MSNALPAPWPELPTAGWRETYDTLHLWTQVVGKIRYVRSPWLNHSWHVALYVTARGLTTSPIPDGTRTFQIDFDFIDHVLRIFSSDGAQRQLILPGQSVASFYAAVMTALAELGIQIAIDEMPNELPDPIKFSLDRKHASYDPDAVRRFFQILVNADRVFKQFRTGFLGKASPVHFFWGSFDLAVTRFSGRRAPRHPGGVPNLPDAVACEAYSHEVMQRRLLAGQRRDRLSRVLFLYLSRTGRLSRDQGPDPAPPSSAKRSANSSCPMTPCAPPPIPTARCWNSCKAHMRLRPIPRDGTATRWNAHSVGRVWCG